MTNYVSTNGWAWAAAILSVVSITMALFALVDLVVFIDLFAEQSAPAAAMAELRSRAVAAIALLLPAFSCAVVTFPNMATLFRKPLFAELRNQPFAEAAPRWDPFDDLRQDLQLWESKGFRAYTVPVPSSVVIKFAEEPSIEELKKLNAALRNLLLRGIVVVPPNVTVTGQGFEPVPTAVECRRRMMKWGGPRSG